MIVLGVYAIFVIVRFLIALVLNAISLFTIGRPRRDLWRISSDSFTMVQLAQAIRELTMTREVNNIEPQNPQLALELPMEVRRDPPQSQYAPPPRGSQSQIFQRPPLPLQNNVDLQEESVDFLVHGDKETV